MGQFWRNPMFLSSFFFSFSFDIYFDHTLYILFLAYKSQNVWYIRYWTVKPYYVCGSVGGWVLSNIHLPYLRWDWFHCSLTIIWSTHWPFYCTPSTLLFGLNIILSSMPVFDNGRAGMRKKKDLVAKVFLAVLLEGREDTSKSRRPLQNWWHWPYQRVVLKFILCVYVCVCILWQLAESPCFIVGR